MGLHGPGLSYFMNAMAACLRSISMKIPLAIAVAMTGVVPMYGTAGAKEEKPPVVEVPAKYAAELPECDRVEVFLLGEMQDEEAKGTFPIRPYKQFAKVEKMREVKGEPAKKLGAAWRGVTFDFMNQALCHHPVYGVRFHAGDKLQFETSICFGCSNFYYQREGGGSSWHGFQTKDEAGKALRAALEEVIPLPPKKEE